jgi:DNA-binding transcriptional ArsR family regulator
MGVVRGAHQARVLLGHNRRQLLDALAEPDSAAGLARRLGLPRQRLNYHLKLLEREGLVALVETRRKGNCTERLMRATARAFVISPEALGGADLTTPASGDRASVGALVGAAADAIRRVAALDARARSAGKRLATLTLDTEIRFASAEARARFMEELVALTGRLAGKYHDETAKGGRRFRLLTLAHPAERPPETGGGSNAE